MREQELGRPNARTAFSIAFLLIVAYVGWWASLRYPLPRKESVKPLVAFSVGGAPQNNGLLPFEEQTMDFNGDGKEERVFLTLRGEMFVREAVLTNEESVNFVVPTNNENPDETFHVAQLVKGGESFVLVGFSGPSSDYTTVFMRYTGKDWVSVGELPGSAETMQFIGNGSVITDERTNMPDTWFVRATYRFVGDHFERIEQSFYERHDREILTAKIPVMLEGEFGTMAVRPGESVRILGCDNVDRCQVVNSKGQKGWFSMSVGGAALYEAFDGWNMAD